MDSRTRWLGILLAAAFAFHNLEEGLTFARYSESITVAQALVGLPPLLPDWSALRMALVLATVLPLSLIAWSLTPPFGQFKAAALVALTAILTANAVVPHLLLTLALRSYTPGAVTALAVNLPLGIALLVRLKTGGQLSARQWAFAVVAGLVVLPFALVGILGISGGLPR